MLEEAVHLQSIVNKQKQKPHHKFKNKHQEREREREREREHLIIQKKKEEGWGRQQSSNDVPRLTSIGISGDTHYRIITQYTIGRKRNEIICRISKEYSSG